MRSESQARERGRCAEHLLPAALFLGAALKEDMWEGGYSWGACVSGKGDG